MSHQKNLCATSKYLINGPVINILASIFLALASTVANAIPSEKFLNAKYLSYEMDVNGDGCKDYLIKEKRQYAILPAGKKILPIPLPVAANSLLLLSTSGSSCSYSAVQPSSSQLLNSEWETSSYNVIVGDIKGDGQGSFFIFSPLSDVAFNVVRTVSGGYTLVQTLSSTSIGLNGDGASISFLYANGDARSDLLVSQGGALLGVYISQQDGTILTNGVENKYASAIACWQRFVQYLTDEDMEGALSLLDESIRDAERLKMTAPGAQPFQLPSRVSRFEVVKEEGGGVQIVLVEPKDGQDWLYLITIASTEESGWKIVSF